MTKDQIAAACKMAGNYGGLNSLRCYPAYDVGVRDAIESIREMLDSIPEELAIEAPADVLAKVHEMVLEMLGSDGND